MQFLHMKTAACKRVSYRLFPDGWAVVKQLFKKVSLQVGRHDSQGGESSGTKMSKGQRDN
jgi:hypothetical protein